MASVGCWRVTDVLEPGISSVVFFVGFLAVNVVFSLRYALKKGRLVSLSSDLRLITWITFLPYER
jgi:hypothetical protein